MSRQAAIGWVRVALIAGFVAALEVLCRLKIINSLTLIPPSEMVTSLWELMVAGKITDDIAQTFSTVAIAFALSVIGLARRADPRAPRCAAPSIRCWHPIIRSRLRVLSAADRAVGLNTIPLIVIVLVRDRRDGDQH